MTRTKSLSFILLVALPVSSSGFSPDNSDYFPRQDLNIDTQAATRDLKVHRTENRNERQPLDKDELLTAPSRPVPTSALTVGVSTLANRNYLQHVRGLERRGPEDGCDHLNLIPPKISSCVSVDIASSVSTSVSSSVSTPVSSSVSTSVSSSVSTSVSSSVSASMLSVMLSVMLSSDASALSATLEALSSSALAAVQSASDAGFRDGLKQASASAQTAVDAPSASASCAAIGSNYASHNYMNKLSQEQRLRLASIVIAVFFASSILSILATVFILQYRRHLASISHKMLDSAIGSKRQMPRPMSGNMRGNLPSSKYPANVAAGRSELTKEFTPKLQQGMALPTKNHLGISSTDWPAFVSPVSPASIDNQVCAVSPPSDRPIDNSGRDDLLRAGPGLYGSETYTSSKFQTTNVPPNEIPLEGYPALHKLQRAHIAGMGTREPTLHNLLFHERIGNAFTSNDIPEPRTGADEELSTREVTNRREGGTAALTPAAKTNAFSAPVIPLRFSSLNAYKSPPSQNSIGSHWDNEAFIAAMDDGTAASGHPFFWNQPRYQSPPQPTYVSRDLTDPNPGIADEQPVSRFSVSTAPLSSIESSSSSPPPVPRHRPQQLEHLEISGLRPAPSSPSQLQSPVPRRPNLAAIVASMEPSTRRALNNSTPTAF